MVDNVGNRLGPRKTFVYFDDLSVQRNIVLDASVATALGNSASTNSNLPRLYVSVGDDLQPRYVLMQLKTDPNVRKKAIICDYTNALFLSNAASEVTINGVVWVITARIGEKRSTLTVDVGPPLP